MMPKRLDPTTLEVLAETTCGGGGGYGAAEYSAPGVYRSKSDIFSFFARAGVPARGQSSTRKWFVLESLQELNEEAGGDLAPPGIERVILRLANPQEYRGDMNTTQELIGHVNGVLKLEGLEVFLEGIKPRLRQVEASAPPPKPEGRPHEPAPDFVKIIGEPALGTVLVGRWQEAQKCMDAGAHLSAIVMMGSVLEGVLLAKAEANLPLVNKASAAPKDRTGKPRPLQDWSLSALIDVAYEVGWLQVDVKRFSHSLRGSRNIVHPYVHRLEKDSPDADTCAICWQVVRAAIADLLGGDKATTAGSKP